MALSLKRLLVGAPLETARAHEEKLPIVLALPIFASDALSSVAYASEEIMAALLVAGTEHFSLTPWLSLGIIVLLAIVVTSYRQTVIAYPNGGGAYIVARDNLGEVPAQAAGAALLVDYILTVAVSVSAGVAAIVSLVKNLFSTKSHRRLCRPALSPRRAFRHFHEFARHQGKRCRLCVSGLFVYRHHAFADRAGALQVVGHTVDNPDPQRREMAGARAYNERRTNPKSRFSDCFCFCTRSLRAVRH
jgi:hypothetical protein